MQILKGVSLKLHSTMRLGGTVDYLVNVKTREELLEAETWAENKQLPVMLIGSGSNIIWRDEGFKGLLLVNKIKGFKKIEDAEDYVTYQIGAGENWDSVVERLVELKLQGVECLSLIPGTAGATPIQNVGAYGQDISQTLTEIEAYDRMEKEFVTIANKDCSFSYRQSRFKGVDKGRFLICSITLKLKKAKPTKPFYDSLQSYLNDKKISDPSLLQIRKAVISIRSQKLPDPNKVANNGSFFANPIVNRAQHSKLVRKYSDIKSWEVPGGYKISAAWLIEKAGFKGKKDIETGMSIWKNQSLVLINESAKTTNDLIKYQDKITEKVYEISEINLEREPEILP